jgi:predicted Zn-dependent peptidase
MDQIRKLLLPNGVRLLFERIPYVRSASLGLWLDVGSRNENQSENGLSHFIEHMFFKGTETKDAYRISSEMNQIGGNINAFTTQENICVSGKVVDEHVGKAIDLISEVCLHSAFQNGEIRRERNVILEEVKMYNDTPDELVVDHFMALLYADNPLGRPILGPPENIERFKRDDIRAYREREFAPDRMVVALAGNFDLRRVEPQLRRIFEPISPNGWERNPVTPPAPAYQSHNEDRDLEQVHFCMGTDAPKRNSDDRFAFAVLNTILGGGPASRIFQEVRERRGLAYSIGSFDSAFKDAGCFAISGGSSPRTIRKVINLCIEEVRRICTEDVTDEELASAKEQIKTAVVLGMENTSHRMARLAETEMFFGEYIPVDLTLSRVNTVTKGDVRDVAERYLKGRPVAFASIGQQKKFEPFLHGVAF